MSFLLDVPLKKTEEVNWVKPLNNYLLSIYGNTSEYQEDLNALNKLRQDIRGVSGSDPTSIALYCKYYSQMELLDLRVPFSTINKHKKIEFVWHDVFQRNVQHTQHALAFEKANVLFNLAAALSRRAVVRHHDSRKDEGKEEAVKESIQLFQQSAGVFQFLSENFLHAPSHDLNQATVTFLKSLMLAQSMEVFVEKVISGDLDQTKNSLISKLCSATAVRYDGCLAMIAHLTGDDYGESESDEEEEEEDGIESIRPEVNKVKAHLHVSWIATVHLKSIYYRSLAFYFNGLQLESTRKYGQALANLSKSAELVASVGASTLKGVASASSNNSYEILDAFKYQQDAVKIKLAELQKDNDLIYHEIVPPLATLAEIKPMDSTKVIPINENPMFQKINEQNYSYFLSNVVPINIHELMSYYSEEKSQFLRNELDLVAVSNEEVQSMLDYLKLPKAFVDFKMSIQGTVEGVPTSCKDVADRIAAAHAMDAANRAKVSQLRQQIYDSVMSVEHTMKEDAIRVKKSLYDASQSDAKLYAMVDTEKELYDALAAGSKSSQFQQLFAVKAAPEVSLLDLDDGVSDTSQPQFQALEDSLNDIHVLRRNKDKLIEALKKEIHEDDISDILILNSKIKSSAEIKSVIFPAELKKFEPYNAELDKLISKERECLESVKEKWALIQNDRGLWKKSQESKNKQAAAEATAQRIQSLGERARDYSNGLQKAVDFYSKLLDYTLSLKQQEDPRLTQQFANMRVHQNAPHPDSNSSVGYKQTGGSQIGPQMGSPMLYKTDTSGLGPSLPPKRPQEPESKQNDTGLIYNQPSTYEPDMYSFFGKH